MGLFIDLTTIDELPRCEFDVVPGLGMAEKITPNLATGALDDQGLNEHELTETTE
jgi:hypothetical protein